MSDVSLLGSCAKMRRALGLVTAYVMRPSGRGPKQVAVLYQLAQSSFSMRELASLVGSDPAATTRTVNALIEAGLVERQKDATDTRKVVVALTDGGRQSMPATAAIVNEIEEIASSTLTRGERAEFIRLVDKLVTGLADLGYAELEAKNRGVTKEASGGLDPTG